MASHPNHERLNSTIKAYRSNTPPGYQPDSRADEAFAWARRREMQKIKNFVSRPEETKQKVELREKRQAVIRGSKTHPRKVPVSLAPLRCLEKQPVE